MVSQRCTKWKMLTDFQNFSRPNFQNTWPSPFEMIFIICKNKSKSEKKLKFEECLKSRENSFCHCMPMCITQIGSTQNYCVSQDDEKRVQRNIEEEIEMFVF